MKTRRGMSFRKCAKALGLLAEHPKCWQSACSNVSVKHHSQGTLSPWTFRWVGWGQFQLCFRCRLWLSQLQQRSAALYTCSAKTEPSDCPKIYWRQEMNFCWAERAVRQVPYCFLEILNYLLTVGKERKRYKWSGLDFQFSALGLWSVITAGSAFSR